LGKTEAAILSGAFDSLKRFVYLTLSSLAVFKTIHLEVSEGLQRKVAHPCLLTSWYSLPPPESVKLISASPLSFVEEINNRCHRPPLSLGAARRQRKKP